MNLIGIFGTSGFAREVGDIALALGYQPLYIARDQTELDAWSFAGKAMLESEVDGYRGIGFAIGIGENAIRQRIAQRFASQLTFTNLIHPSATFGQGQREIVQARQGIIVCAGVRFTNNIQVGDFGVFNLNATIGHDVIVEDFVNIAPGAHVSGNVHIGPRCWIGTGAAINQGQGNAKLHIGADTVIGSGSVVVKACEPHSVYVGIPAKKIK